MNTNDFNAIIREQIDRCENTLCKKAEEYATEDRLHNFKVAGSIQSCLPTTALAGMMCKHTVSVYDMVQGLENGEEYSLDMWNEKIGDSINYLLLLAAMVREQRSIEKEEYLRLTAGWINRRGFFDGSDNTHEH